jgi:hypothetical protein
MAVQHLSSAVRAGLRRSVVILGSSQADSQGREMSMVEIWCSMAERQATHRGSYCSVRELIRTICASIDGWNDRAHPCTWTKTAEQVLTKARRPSSVSRAVQGGLGDREVASPGGVAPRRTPGHSARREEGTAEGDPA